MLLSSQNPVDQRHKPSRLDQCLSWWQGFQGQDDALMKLIRSGDLFHRIDR